MRLILTLLALILTACLPPPVTAGANVTRTTRGGEALPWNLRVYDPTRTTLLHEWTPAAPGGLDGGFEWQLTPDGDTVNLQFSARNDVLGLPPRGVVVLTVDGQPAFHGVAPDAPSLGSPEAETVLVAGGAEALRVTLMDGAVYRSQGVYAIARDILARLCPPALLYDATQIGDGTGTDAGPTLDTFYDPTAPLTDVLKTLAASARVPWGVDAAGRVFLGRPATAGLNVAYAGQPWRRLPSQGRETVTRSVLRVVSAPSEGVVGYTQALDATDTLYLPATVSAVAENPLHGTYHAEASFAAPDGVGLLRERRDFTLDSSGMTSPENAVDGSGTTSANNTEYTAVTLGTAALVALVENTPGVRVVGMRFTYTLAPGDVDVLMQALVAHTAPGATLPQDILTLDLPPSDAARTITMIAPPSARLASLPESRAVGQLMLYARAPLPANALRVYDLALLIVDETAAGNVAASYLQVPFAAPAEITLPGLQAPRPTVTVTDSPDGNVTADAGLYVYTITPDGGRQTLVRLGSTGQDPAVRALRLAVRP